MKTHTSVYGVKAIIIGREKNLGDGVYLRRISVRVSRDYYSDGAGEVVEELFSASNLGHVQILFEPENGGEPLCTPSQDGGQPLPEASSPYAAGAMKP